jgi:hypothetical protein
VLATFGGYDAVFVTAAGLGIAIAALTRLLLQR